MSKDVVISTRIRLARNLNDYPFPCKLSDQGKDEVCNKVQTALKESNSVLGNEIKCLDLSNLSNIQCDNISFLKKVGQYDLNNQLLKENIQRMKKLKSKPI